MNEDQWGKTSDYAVGKAKLSILQDVLGFFLFSAGSLSSFTQSSLMFGMLPLKVQFFNVQSYLSLS